MFVAIGLCIVNLLCCRNCMPLQVNDRIAILIEVSTLRKAMIISGNAFSCTVGKSNQSYLHHPAGTSVISS